MKVYSTIDTLKESMVLENITPEKGLGKELFLFASTLIPVINVDLIVTNSNREVLLSWRNDPHFGAGWHVPGGCLRLGEHLQDRLDKTAANEFGSCIKRHTQPLKIFEIFSAKNRDGSSDQRERSHFITIVYGCELADLNEVDKRLYQGDLSETQMIEVGQLRWFKELPENLLEVQRCYLDEWHEITERIWR